MPKKLHIVSLDIPFPPDYGGMVDVWYKIKSLFEAGVQITLHCFQYGGRQAAPELLRYCHAVYYYPRKMGWKGLHATLPYIVSSRNDPQLLQHLLQDEAPILFEGLHCLYWHHHPALHDRIKWLRAHNIESDYYRMLAGQGGAFLKRLYYYFESARLNRYESTIKQLNHIFAISKPDTLQLQKIYPNIPVTYVPAFHGISELRCKTGKGNYCLYQGNLQVAENRRAAKFLANEVFCELNIPLVIAGKSPGPDLLALQSDKIRIIQNPNEATMQQLVQDAQIHVLPVYQHTGTKLKILHALFAGRHCISNEHFADDEMAGEVKYAGSAKDFQAQIVQYFDREFTPSDFATRQLLFDRFSNNTAVKELLHYL